MRKVLWCCTAVLFTAVCLAHGASTYAVGHPQSVAARFVVASYTLFGSNPLYRAGTVTVAGAAVALGSGDATVDVTAHLCRQQYRPVAATDSLTPTDDQQQTAEARLPGEFVIASDEIRRVTRESVLPYDLEYCEPGCLTMPFSADDPKPAPAVLPYLCDDSQCH